MFTNRTSNKKKKGNKSRSDPKNKKDKNNKTVVFTDFTPKKTSVLLKST